MNQIRVVLWDIDGTLLNFEAAETYAIRACFSACGLGECTDEMLEDYSGINRKYWQRLERGELTKPQVLEGRFVEFFGKYGLDTGCVAKFNSLYQVALGDTFCFHDQGLETVQALHGTVKQYAVTNGTAVAQKRKLAGSGLDKLLDGVFISEEVGVEKPGAEFFHRVFQQIGEYAPDEVLIVGDSLTSDIQGGNNAGIRCCWFNPKGSPAKEGLRIDYQIQQLPQVLDICGLK